MGSFTIHAGSWPKGKGQFNFGSFAMPKASAWGGFDGVSGTELLSAEIATEEAVKRLGGTVGWGVAGAVLLGPVGLLAGLLAGGRGKDVTFVATFSGDRKMLATTDAKTFTKIQALVFK